MNANIDTKKTPAIACEIGMNEALSTVSLAHSVISLSFSDGSVIEVQTVNLSPEILSRALAHGLKQKLIDAAAKSKDARIEDKYEAVFAVADALNAGEWNRKREGSGTSGGGGLLFRALCEVFPNRTPAEVREWLKGKSKEQQAALRADKKIAKIILRLQSEGADTETAADLLTELA